jgi:putative ABC transport system permease protein
MIRNHFIIALRNLKRNKLHAAINILGLAIGISACMAIFLIVEYQLSFDTFRADRERIYRVYTSFSGAFSATNRGVPAPLGPALRDEGSGIEALTAFFTWGAKVRMEDPASHTLDTQKDIAAADPEFFEVFPDAEWIAGNPRSALDAPHQVAISESKARLYFGDIAPAEAMGRTLVYADSLTVTVAGVFKDPPPRTDLAFQDFISYSTVRQSWLKDRFSYDIWSNTNSNSQVFLRLAKGMDLETMHAQLEKFNQRYETENPGASWKATFHLQPFTDLHFNTKLNVFDQMGIAAHRPTLYGMIMVAVLLLLIAAVNFVNLETAQSARRAREVGVRKTLGGTRGALMRQFLGETLLLVLCAAALSLALTDWSLRLFEEFIPDGVTLRLHDPRLLLFLLVTIVAITTLAGAYPAFALSSYKPVDTLKAQFAGAGNAWRAVTLRKGLIVFQFVIAQALIFVTLVIGRQIRFMLDKDMGFDQDAIVLIHTPWLEKAEKVAVLEQELRRMPELAMLSRHASPPAQSGYNTSVMKYERGDVKLEINVHRKFGDTAYIRLYNMELLAGRNLLPSDTVREFIVNETLARRMGFDSPSEVLGQHLYLSNRPIPVVGVVRDFHLTSLHHAIEPAAIADSRRDFSAFSLKLRTEGKNLRDFTAVIGKVERAWNEIYPDHPFSYSFFDESLAKMYANERRAAKLVGAGATIAIFISCLGLFGLISFMALQRTKEIGVRKVLGASAAHIVALLSSDFLRLALLASAIAFPIGWYLAGRWLSDFAYRIAVDWRIFVCTTLAALLITSLTVGWKALGAARANPAESLRDE